MQVVDPDKVIHPLRNTLTQEDWARITRAMETEDVDAITDEELDAAHDVLYDAIAAKMQTHHGSTVLQ